MKKEMNNKGFSLVELIVVIAIMAVLIGVLAPQFLRYVEKSRLQKDNQAISEIANAAKAAMANEKVYDAVGTTGTTISGGAGKSYSFTGTDAFNTEMKDTVGETVKLNSKTYSSAPNITVAVNASTKTVEVSTDGFIAEVGDSAASKIF